MAIKAARAPEEDRRCPALTPALTPAPSPSGTLPGHAPCGPPRPRDGRQVVRAPPLAWKCELPGQAPISASWFLLLPTQEGHKRTPAPPSRPGHPHSPPKCSRHRHKMRLLSLRPLRMHRNPQHPAMGQRHHQAKR
ncbi:putative uncharacterized protein GUCA1ANB isoform X3 [Artibeus jamaicensis]|uniref:putative uncharacterized protein GUCA1ANB isoform X3 n=1 Tax=Artibeus jamaicensis TaxID=9417 RepID=UPI00235A58FE|nr:putative uncharacterized protein GUCA1ANB isoform X3 [Artibeus jamaicensis]